MTNILLDLIIILGCAIVFGLICIVLAFAWWCVKFIACAAKEASKECSVATDAPSEKSDATQSVNDIKKKKPSSND